MIFLTEGWGRGAPQPAWSANSMHPLTLIILSIGPHTPMLGLYSGFAGYRFALSIIIIRFLVYSKASERRPPVHDSDVQLDFVLEFTQFTCIKRVHIQGACYGVLGYGICGICHAQTVGERCPSFQRGSRLFHIELRSLTRSPPPRQMPSTTLHEFHQAINHHHFKQYRSISEHICFLYSCLTTQSLILHGRHFPCRPPIY